MQTEKRAHQRVSFFLLSAGKKPVWSFSNNEATTAGIMIDISPFGGRLLVKQSGIACNDIVTISLQAKSNDLDNALEISANILWLNQSKSSDDLEIGCQFVDLSKQAKLYIMNIIKSSNMKSDELFVRCELKLEKQKTA